MWKSDEPTDKHQTIREEAWINEKEALDTILENLNERIESMNNDRNWLLLSEQLEVCTM